jgi:hypothetical protein
MPSRTTGGDHGSDFTIQVSDDGSAWTTVVTVTGNTANVTTHTGHGERTLRPAQRHEADR